MILQKLFPHLFAAVQLGKPCTLPPSSFLSLPTWYAYLPGMGSYAPGYNATTANPQYVCVPSIHGLSDIWLIVAAIIEILLRLAAIIAIGMIIYGGIQFITSQGEPDKAAQARGTVINALIGLVITIAAATIVTFIAGQFGTVNT